jgi:hypothetical protein
MRTVLRPFLTALLALSFTAGYARIGDDEIMQMESSIVIERIDNSDVEIGIPSMAFTFSDAEIKIKFKNPQHTKLLTNNDTLTFIINGDEIKIAFVNGEGSFRHRFDKSNSIQILVEDLKYEATVSAYPLWIFFVPVGFVGAWVALGRLGRKKAL